IDDTTRALAARTQPPLAREQRPKPPAPSPEADSAAEIDQLWRLIGNDDGDDVGVALRRLVALGDPAVAPLVKRLLPPADPATPKRIQSLIERLGSDDPRIREQ